MTMNDQRSVFPHLPHIPIWWRMSYFRGPVERAPPTTAATNVTHR
jgi:hypothetical protein